MKTLLIVQAPQTSSNGTSIRTHWLFSHFTPQSLFRSLSFETPTDHGDFYMEDPRALLYGGHPTSINVVAEG